jgi:hypothetical protein
MMMRKERCNEVKYKSAELELGMNASCSVKKNWKKPILSELNCIQTNETIGGGDDGILGDAS